MQQNVFMGAGFFGSRQLPVVGPTLGQFQTGYQWNRGARPIQSRQWAPRPGPIQRITRPTSQPTAASGSDVGCYFCGNLPGAPTYWLSGNQADQWNRDRDARCEKVDAKDCREKYGQLRAQQQASIRRTGFNAFNLPGAATYAPMMTGGVCRHRAMSRPYLGQVPPLRCWQTQDGGTVCSDLMYHPPACPTSPVVTESEVLATPPEAAQAVCGGGGIKVSPSAIPSGTMDQPSEFPIVPVAIGGAALIGLILALR